MKKCPECGNPSYDGAPACGNCGYKFPKMKPSAPKKEIFDKAPEKKKKQFSDEESTIEIIKENKILIGANYTYYNNRHLRNCHHRTKQ